MQFKLSWALPPPHTIGSAASDTQYSLLSALTPQLYLDGVGGDLDLVKSTCGAITVNKVGRGELVQRLYPLRGIHHLSVQLVLCHVHGQSLLACTEEERRSIVLFPPLSPSSPNIQKSRQLSHCLSVEIFSCLTRSGCIKS